MGVWEGDEVVDDVAFVVEVEGGEGPGFGEDGEAVVVVAVEVLRAFAGGDGAGALEGVAGEITGEGIGAQDGQRRRSRRGATVAAIQLPPRKSSGVRDRRRGAWAYAQSVEAARAVMSRRRGIGDKHTSGRGPSHSWMMSQEGHTAKVIGYGSGSGADATIRTSGRKDDLSEVICGVHDSGRLRGPEVRGKVRSMTGTRLLAVTAALMRWNMASEPT